MPIVHFPPHPLQSLPICTYGQSYNYNNNYYRLCYIRMHSEYYLLIIVIIIIKGPVCCYNYNRANNNYIDCYDYKWIAHKISCTHTFFLTVVRWSQIQLRMSGKCLFSTPVRASKSLPPESLYGSSTMPLYTYVRTHGVRLHNN